MRSQLLFRLRARHPGYPGEQCTALSIEPRSTSRGGERALERHRLVARPRHGGLDLFAPVDERGRPFLDFRGLNLSFDIDVHDRSFFARTELSEFRKLDAPTWRRRRSGEELHLAEGDIARSPHAFAGIELRDVSARWLRQPRSYVLPFEASRSLWAYYLLTRHRAPAPAIVDTERERGIAFHGGPLSARDSLAAEDPFAAQLLASHPGSACARLISSRPLSCDAGPSGLALQVGDQIALSSLPTPPPDRQIALTLAGESRPTAAVACVIQY